MNTIQERNRRLYLVKQNGGQFEYYPTIYIAAAFRAAFGNHDGEQVEPGNVEGIWKSLDGQRRYVLAQLEPEWVEGVELKIAETPSPPVSEPKLALTEPVFEDCVVTYTDTNAIPNKEVETVTLKKEEEKPAPAKPKRPARKTRWRSGPERPK